MVTRSAGRVVGLDPEADHTALGLATLSVALVGVSLWTSAVASAVGYATPWFGGFPWSLLLVSGLTSVVGLVLGSVAYARYRGYGFAYSLPRRGTWAPALGAVLAPAVAVVGVAAVGNAVFDVALSAMVQRWTSPDAPVGHLLLVGVPPAAFAGLGYGFLLGGVVCERVRGLVGPEDAAAVAAALVGFFWLLPVDAFRGLRLGVRGTVEVAVTLLFGAAFGAGLGLLYRHAGDGSPGAGLERRHVPVFVVALVGLVGVGTDLAALPRAVGDLLWVVALGIAAVGYERTRSVWVPVLGLTAFNLAITGVVYAEAVLGLATP